MTHPEASFLQERIQSSQPDTLLSFLVGLGERFEDAPYSPEHPYFEQFPGHVKSQLHHARAFSEIAQGATLLYNHMLAKASPNSAEEGRGDDVFEDELEQWAGLVEDGDALASWDRDEFWRVVFSANARVPATTRAFVDDWCDLVLAPGGAAGIASNARAQMLIRNCEHATKGPLARLSNPRRLEMWNRPDRVYPYTYGWRSTRQLLVDIADGFRGADGA